MSSRTYRMLLAALAAGSMLQSAATVTRADEVGVSSAAEITEALKIAKPGDVLVMTDGDWKDQMIKVTGKGTKEEPIELRAQTPGKVKLLGNSSVMLAGDWCVVSGVFFGESTSEEPAVAFVGNDNRFTDSAIVSQDRGGKWIHFRQGQRNRLDHCYIEGHELKEPTLQVEIDEKTPNEARIDHNHFGPRPPLGANGGETMRIGYSGQQTRVSRTLVEHNLFDRCDGEVEIISSKCTDSTYRYNTFRDCEGTITLRHGGHCTVDGNFFFGKSNGKSGGVRVIGAGHTIVNNYFENVGTSGGGGVIALTSAMREPKPTDYQHVNGALVAFNTIVNSGLPYVRLDSGFNPERARDVLPKDVIVANNLFLAGNTEIKGEGNTLVDGREGTGFKWSGNLAHGAEAGAGTAASGIRDVDPKLKKGDDGVYRPGADSPARDAAIEADFAKVEKDIDGQPRSGKKDVGADELSDAKPMNKPVSPANVGPSWMKPPRDGAKTE